MIKTLIAMALIALAFYGAGRESSVKNEGKFEQKETVQVVEPPRPTIEKPVEKKRADKYTVQGDESLWTISQRVYGRGEAWRKLWAFNFKRVSDPHRIRPGLVLNLPPADWKPKKMPKVSRVPKGYEYWKTVRAKITAYCPCRICCKGHSDGRTAKMQNAWRMDGCSTAFAAIPAWTMVRIPGIGLKKVDDTGGAMRKSWKKGVYHIDVRMTYHWQAQRYGTEWHRVELYKKKRH